MMDRIAGDEAPAERQSKTRQFYGFMGETNYNEAFIQELSRDFEEGGYYHDHAPMSLEERIVVDETVQGVWDKIERMCGRRSGKRPGIVSRRSY